MDVLDVQLLAETTGDHVTDFFLFSYRYAVFEIRIRLFGLAYMMRMVRMVCVRTFSNVYQFRIKLVEKPFEQSIHGKISIFILFSSTPLPVRTFATFEMSGIIYGILNTRPRPTSYCIQSNGPHQFLLFSS